MWKKQKFNNLFFFREGKTRLIMSSRRVFSPVPRPFSHRLNTRRAVWTADPMRLQQRPACGLQNELKKITLSSGNVQPIDARSIPTPVRYEFLTAPTHIKKCFR